LPCHIRDPARATTEAYADPLPCCFERDIIISDHAEVFEHYFSPSMPLPMQRYFTPSPLGFSSRSHMIIPAHFPAARTLAALP